MDSINKETVERIVLEIDLVETDVFNHLLEIVKRYHNQLPRDMKLELENIIGKG